MKSSTDTTPDEQTYRELLDHIDDCDICGGKVAGRYCSEGYRLHLLVRASQRVNCCGCDRPIGPDEDSRLVPAAGDSGSVGMVRRHMVCPGAATDTRHP